MHLGSLTTAVASYLHARQAGGEWLVRIEDIDPQREVPGATDAILRCLEALELHWDREVVLQSRHVPRYRNAASDLLARGIAFYCSCTRRELQSSGAPKGRYPGTCRRRRVHGKATGVRVRVEPGTWGFCDGLHGLVESPLSAACGDYLIYRRDGLPAYHLAVVVDDAAQGVTTVVRGGDLLDLTPVHLHLQRQLGYPEPAYFHVPLLTRPDGHKLSKQSGAVPIDDSEPARAAAAALQLLGSDPPPELRGAAPGILWHWALDHWRIECLAKQRTFALT